MALLRQRKKQQEGAITPQSDLKAALSKVHQKALREGLSEGDFSSCLASAAGQHGIALEKKPKRNSFSSAVKVLWLAFLLVVVAVIVVFSSPLGFQLQRTLHSSMYSLLRSVRFAVIALSPYFQALDLGNLQECMVRNPFGQACPCLGGQMSEITASDGFTIPRELFESPKHVTVIRQAVVQEFQLELIQDFHKVTGRNPRVCMEVSDESLDGPKFYRELFDREKMDEYFALPVPWGLTW